MRCDSHVHIVGPTDQYPQIAERNYIAGPAPLQELIRNGSARDVNHFVIVQPSFYGDDNSMLLAALKALGGRGRGVAVVSPDNISNAALGALHDEGVRGLRMNLYSPLAGQPIKPLEQEFSALTAIAQRHNWHLELIAPIEAIAQNAELIRRAGVQVVIDHYGLYGNQRPDTAAGKVLIDLIGRAHVWMKLSAPYRHDRGPLNTAPDAAWLKACLTAAPDRCVWGSDWPHPPVHDSQKGPDVPIPYRRLSYTELFDRFVEAVSGDALRQSVLWDNPARLYHF